MELYRDQGRKFESRVMKEILERLGVSKTRTILHPQSDGMVECYVETSLHGLRK
jgi:hypothetical protein